MPAAWAHSTAANVLLHFGLSVIQVAFKMPIYPLLSFNKLDGMARPTLSYRRIVVWMQNKQKIALKNCSTIGQSEESEHCAISLEAHKSSTLSCQSWISPANNPLPKCAILRILCVFTAIIIKANSTAVTFFFRINRLMTETSRNSAPEIIIVEHYHNHCHSKTAIVCQ